MLFPKDKHLFTKNLELGTENLELFLEIPMPQYLYHIQPTRLAMLTESTSDEQRIVGEHFQYLQTLTEQGVVILAGRTLNNDASTFGIIIFNAESETAAQRIVENDPAVKLGVMRSQLFPYSVALIAEKNVQSA
jgi:uncharacterized protein YciI